MALTALHVAVIGGGAIGVTAAYELCRRGADVTLFEPVGIGCGASYGNAGLLVPSYSAPLASRANLLEGIRSVFGGVSAVDVKLTPSWNVLTWFARFALATRADPARRGLETLAMLTQDSLKGFSSLLSSGPVSVDYGTAGTLYVAKTADTMTETAALATRLHDFGISSQVLSASEAVAKEPTLSGSIAGAVWYPGDAKVQPFQFVTYVAGLAERCGVSVRNDRITGIALRGTSVAGVRTANEIVSADYVVLAAGSWSAALGASVGLRVPILPAKGYSIDFTLARQPRVPMLFSERHVSATPMNGAVRATTGLDFHGLDAKVLPERIDSIRNAFVEYLQEPEFSEQTAAWVGFRPLTPDGLPIVGRSSRIQGLVFGTGHGPLGITLAPVTAKLVVEAIVDDLAPPEAISPHRFGI